MVDRFINCKPGNGNVTVFNCLSLLLLGLGRHISRSLIEVHSTMKQNNIDVVGANDVVNDDDDDDATSWLIINTTAQRDRSSPGQH